MLKNAAGVHHRLIQVGADPKWSLRDLVDDLIGKFFGMMDIFIIWWLVVLAIGLAVLYRRKTQPIALTLLGIYLLIAVGVAAFTSRS